MLCASLRRIFIDETLQRAPVQLLDQSGRICIRLQATHDVTATARLSGAAMRAPADP
jgi:hypothetical protein